MPSGAQLNRWGTLGGITLLSADLNVTAVASPNTGYGTIGYNDSGPFVTPIGLSKVTFTLIGAGSLAAGYSVTIFGTIDPRAYLAYTHGSTGADPAPTAGGTSLTFPSFQFPAIPASSWVPIPGPSEQGGTGAMANPMVSGTSRTFLSGHPWVAFRAVVTTIAAPTLQMQVLGFGIP